MANTPVSPKVTAGASVAAIVGLLLQVGVNITPDTFAFLGAGQGLAFMIVTLGLGALAAWWKTDPLRDVPAVPDKVSPSLAAVLPTPAPVTVESVPALIEVTPDVPVPPAEAGPAPA
jgi:hypothetical protein